MILFRYVCFFTRRTLRGSGCFVGRGETYICNACEAQASSCEKMHTGKAQRWQQAALRWRPVRPRWHAAAGIYFTGCKGQPAKLFTSPCPWIYRPCLCPSPCCLAANLCRAPLLDHWAERSQCPGGPRATACWEQVASKI